MRKKRPDCNEAAKKFLGKILAIFHATGSGRKIYRVKMEKTHCRNIFSCQVCFSETGDDYYHRTCEDPFHFATSEKLLRSGQKQIRNMPKVMDLMGYFERTAFPEEILEQVRLMVQAIHLTDYRVVESKDALEFIRVTPQECERKGA